MHNNLNTKYQKVTLLCFLPKRFHLQTFTTEKLRNYNIVNHVKSTQ